MANPRGCRHVRLADCSSEVDVSITRLKQVLLLQYAEQAKEARTVLRNDIRLDECVALRLLANRSAATSACLRTPE